MARPVIENTSFAEGDGSSFSYSHTCSGTNRGMVVGLMRWNNSGETFSSATYNSVNLTQDSIDELSSGDGHRVSFLSLIDPASGSNTVAVAYSATTSMQLQTHSLNNCNQTTMIGNVPSAVAATANTAPTTDVSTDSATNDLVVDFLAYWVSGGSASVGSGQTEEFNRTTGPTYGAGSREDGTGGTVTMSWTLGVAAAWAIIAGNIFGTNDRFWIFGKKD